MAWILLAALLLCLTCACAFADEIPIKVAMTVSPDTFTEPTTAQIAIKVNNASDRTLPGPVTLYYPNNVQIEDFEPVLEPGASKTWEGTWDVTQAQLDAGKITFRIAFSMYNESGEVENKRSNMAKDIVYNGAVATVEVNRTITPTTAGKGQSVSVTYEVVNTGNVDVTDVTIAEDSSIATQRANLGTIEAGKKASHTFSVKMGTKDLTSRATITYKAGGQTQTVTKEAASITYGESKLSARLTSDKAGGLIGESVKLSLEMKNTGKDDFEALNVTDATLGEVFTGLTVRAGETVTVDTTVPIDRTTDYQFIISGVDSAGNVIENASDRLTIKALDPSEVISLEVFATVDRETLFGDPPATVRFNISVTNRSAVDVTNVSVLAGENTLYTFPTIEAGSTRSFVRDAQINMGGRFQFTARVINQLSQAQTFESNVLQIGFTRPTAVPTDVPLVTPLAPTLEEIPLAEDLPEWYDMSGRALNYAAIALAALAGIGAVLLLIGGINRLINRSKRIAPIDTLEPLDLLQNHPGTEHQAEDDMTDAVEAVEAASSRRRRAQAKENAETDTEAEHPDETQV